MPYKTRRVEPGVYEVVTLTGEVLGTVRRGGDDFWSQYRWSIDGLPCPPASGGVGGKTRKLGGWKKLEYAARHVAVMGSGRILAALSH